MHTPLLRMKGIVKLFSGVRALDGADFTVEAGEAHALVGVSGAGKSTLVKILTGVYRRDAGLVSVEGREVEFRSPADALAAGVVAVYQDANLLPSLTVAENIFLGREPRRLGLIDWRLMNAEAGALLERLEARVDPRAPLGGLSAALRQMVSIARAVSLGAKVVAFDEPTGPLAGREVSIFDGLLRRLKAEGVGVVYASRRCDEVYRLCDRVTVLRDGRHVHTRPLAGIEKLDLVCLMLGKQREELQRGGATAFGQSYERPPEGALLLRAENLTRGRELVGVTLEVGRGEVVGLAGLPGSGSADAARAIFGADPVEGGAVYLEGRSLGARSPHDCIAAGMAFLPADRRAEGIIPELSVRENLTLSALPALNRLGVVSVARQAEVVGHFIRRLGVKVSNPGQKMRQLSGGSQQKVLLARWLCTNPKLLIFDEPTRGVDVDTRGEIHAFISELAESGLGVLLVSSEPGELVEGCARVYVMREGRVAAELRGGQISEDAIMRAMTGGDASDEGTPCADADAQA